VAKEFVAPGMSVEMSLPPGKQVAAPVPVQKHAVVSVKVSVVWHTEVVPHDEFAAATMV